MKITRILMALVATLIFASWCAAQCGPARPKGGSATGSIDDAIIAQEQLIIDAIKKRDANAFKSMVDMNGYEVNAQGSRTLSETVTELFSPDLSISEYKMESPMVKRLDKDSALLTYKSTTTGTYKGQTSSGSSYDTTIYVRRAGKWIAIFHQSTDMAKPGAGMTSEK
ncbi:MAG: nuclear transport factor 2 family protein [Acidobacteria bacterium]|nr:nuclear transport factor 2 family protein [Acidobacteriota bacterium]